MKYRNENFNFFSIFVFASLAIGLPQVQAGVPNLEPPPLNNHFVQDQSVYTKVDEGPYFDLPITYNSKVRKWIKFYQTNGKKDFKRWLERSSKYLPKIQPLLEAKGLPKDLVYLAMIESGFSPRAVSSAAAVGYWQFIKPTANRYGLKVDWWLDERRDIVKSTIAAASYLNDLYKMFQSWYLAAAAYNTGEGRIRSLVKKYNTSNYWIISRQKDFPQETEQYIPKLIAAMLIAKSPKLYGFRDLKPMYPEGYDFFMAPGGTDLASLSLYLGLDRDRLSNINPEIITGVIPDYINSHKIRLPKGELPKAKRYAKSDLIMSN